MRSLARSAAAPGLMILGVLALYFPPGLLDGRETILGTDFFQLHDHRIRYAQEALFSPDPYLPAWYTRELMGTPFASNVQSFPLLPTRLVLLGLDPGILYPVAVNLAAILAALFTYLFCRRLQLGRIASAAAGWTFAASGFFAARVMAGQLALLEAFCALPLLLWCAECIAQSGPEDRKLRLRHLGLALATLCVVLAGHPQIPAYAIGTAALYVLVRMGARRGARALLAMGLGVGLSAVAWWPMLDLVGRSTRVLALDRADNDLSLAYGRLAAFLFPWADGWPPLIQRFPAKDFVGPTMASFWDTVGYVGWMPIVAVLVVLIRQLRIGRAPARPWLFLAAIGVVALLLALPFAHALTSGMQGTILRSPSRQIYLTTFALATATGVFVDLLLATRWRGFRVVAPAVVAILLVLHAADLSIHDRHFIRLVEREPVARERIEVWREDAADQRLAIDDEFVEPVSRQVDDVGFYDSIMLARPYRAILAMSGAAERLNIQNLDGSRLPGPALAGLCVKRVITMGRRDDLPLLAEGTAARSYAVPGSLHRATFVPDSQVRFVDEGETLERFRRGDFDFRSMALAPSDRPADLRAESVDAPDEPVVLYERPDSDHIVVRVGSRSPGYLRVMESWDEGWSVTQDGVPADLLVADTFAMAVRVRPGDHDVRFTYRTPGALVGAIVTLASAILLAIAVLRFMPRARAG